MRIDDFMHNPNVSGNGSTPSPTMRTEHEIAGLRHENRRLKLLLKLQREYARLTVATTR